MPILPGFVPPLFETESNPLRFERVCLALYNAAEGVTLVPTSYNYDQGRDGRTIDLRPERFSGILCATLSVGLDTKVQQDIARLLETTKTNSIVYCTARKITEKECDNIAQTIRAEYPQLEAVQVLSQVQLVALALDYDELLLTHYPGEVRNLQQTLTIGPEADTAALHGLRLALATSVGDTADELRNSLIERLLLEVLTEREQVGIDALSLAVGTQLHLPRSPSPVYLRQALERLQGTGLVVSEHDLWRITEAGRANIQPSEAPAQKLLEGRALIRTALTELTGFSLTDPMFDRVWTAFQAGMADAFHEHGLNLVQSVRSIAEGAAMPNAGNFRELLNRVADRATASLTSQERKEELNQAIVDIFAERSRPAFVWLTEICSVYVMLCSLGLEPRSARQIGEVLKSISLVPDSDIVLSLLCVREANHGEVERIIRGWQALAGSVAIATPVLVEAAHHAWIADRDYIATHHLFHKLDDVEAERLIANAFVRSFWRLSGGHDRNSHWQSYIREYRGTSETDHSLITNVLREEYAIERLPDYLEPSLTPDPDSFEGKLARFIRNSLAEDYGCEVDELDYRTIDKARRDAKLLANLQEARRLATAEQGKTALIVSSARLLREAAVRFRDDFGEPEAVIALPAVATLLAITPGVQLGLGSLQAVLFDAGLSKRLLPLQRLAYRVIAASDVYDLPFARRVTLRRNLRQLVLSDARKRVKRPSQIEQELLDPANEEGLARTLSGALDKMGIHPAVGRVMRQQQDEIIALQAEIRRLREAQGSDQNSVEPD